MSPQCRLAFFFVHAAVCPLLFFSILNPFVFLPDRLLPSSDFLARCRTICIIFTRTWTWVSTYLYTLRPSSSTRISTALLATPLLASAHASLGHSPKDDVGLLCVEIVMFPVFVLLSLVAMHDRDDNEDIGNPVAKVQSF